MLKLGMYVRGFCLDALVLPPVFPPQGSQVLRASFPQVVPAASSITFKVILFTCLQMSSRGCFRDRQS